MTKQLILILLTTFCFSVIKGQFPSDSVVFVYFHTTSDTLFVIVKDLDNPNQKKYYNLTRVFYDSSGVNPYYSKALKFETVNEMKFLFDSLSKVNYVLGVNLSNKCVNTFEISDFKKTSTDKYGYFADYTIKDIRVLSGDTIENHAYKKNKYYFNHKEQKEKLLKKSYKQMTYAWSSADNRMTYYLFQNIFSSFDEDGNEITTSVYMSNMQKNKK